MEQKVIKVGNSLGVIIPKVILDKLGLKAGSSIVIEENTHNNTLIVREASASYVTSTLNEEFNNSVDRVHKKYGKALKELASK